MTGKVQKMKNDAEAFKKAVELTAEDKQQIISDAIAEIYGENVTALEAMKIDTKTFRGGYLLHMFFKQVDDLADRNAQDKLAKNVAKYSAEQAMAKRK